MTGNSKHNPTIYGYTIKEWHALTNDERHTIYNAFWYQWKLAHGESPSNLWGNKLADEITDKDHESWLR